MLLKRIVTTTLIFIIITSGYSQSADSMFCKGHTDNNLIAFISGRQFNDHIEVQFLQKNFSLSLTDTSYKISSFQASWSDNNSIYNRVIYGNIFDQKIDTYNLGNIQPGGFVAFDCITAIKNNEYYKVASFSIKAIKQGAIPEIENNIVCYANLKGFRNGDNDKHTAFMKDLQIELSDSSYKIVDFEISWNIREALYTEIISGNKVFIDKNSNIGQLRRLQPGSAIIIDKIRLSKQGKEYYARKIVMYCK